MKITDTELLQELIGMKVDIKKFESELKKKFRKVSSCKLWFTNIPSKEWTGKEYKDCNFRCCPSSHKARNYFCLNLENEDNNIIIKNGFLTSV